MRRVSCDDIKRDVSIGMVLDLYGISMSPKNGHFLKCPFHGEKTASLKIYPETNSWYCYGCNRGGTVIDWVMLAQETDLTGAVRFLSDRFSVSGEYTAEMSMQLAEHMNAVRKWEQQVEQKKNELKQLDAMIRSMRLRLKAVHDRPVTTGEDVQAIIAMKAKLDHTEYLREGVDHALHTIESARPTRFPIRGNGKK